MTQTNPPVIFQIFQEKVYLITSDVITIKPYHVKQFNLNFTTPIEQNHVLQLVKNPNLPHLVKLCDYLLPNSDKKIMFCLANTTAEPIQLTTGTNLGFLRFVHVSRIVNTLQGHKKNTLFCYQIL